MRPEKNVEAKVWNYSSIDLLSLKLIPSAEEGKNPDVCHLVGCGCRLFPKVDTDGITKLWSGRGNLLWNNPHRNGQTVWLPVKRILDCTYGWIIIYLTYGYVVYDYLKKILVC